jgi:4-amino-4-deoxy-L-arabinose transferase-like glycosyltransferase
MARDIGRPFSGLHSWGEAHNAWVAKSHVKYGLGYTRGFDTFAVGVPPAEEPARYLDHPQLFTLVNASVMAVLGINTWSLRVANIAATAAALLLFIKIVRDLADDLTALLAGLFFAILPLIGYFGVNMWLYPLAFLAIWTYLSVTGALPRAPDARPWHEPVMAICLFLAVQMTWEGFFFAMAIGVHYVCRCIRRRHMPRWRLIAVLAIAPIASLALDFLILTAGRGWDIRGIYDVYKWRATTGEMAEHVWSDWFGRLWEFAVTNFSLPVLIVAIGYLTAGRLYLLLRKVQRHKGTKAQSWAGQASSKRFPQFWLFFMPAVFQLFFLKGALWPHQYWERPLVPVVAIAAALGVRLAGDIAGRTSKAAVIPAQVLLTGILFVSCMAGTNFYYSIRWQPAAKIEMFEMLNDRIPPDMDLLSFEDFIVDQHHAKQASYRPEIAWYLDREIVQAASLEEVERLAETGKYPYYLVPAIDSLSKLTDPLRQRYRLLRYVPGKSGEKTGEGKFLEAGMWPYMIFDLRSRAGGE